MRGCEEARGGGKSERRARCSGGKKTDVIYQAEIRVGGGSGKMQML